MSIFSFVISQYEGKYYYSDTQPDHSYYVWQYPFVLIFIWVIELENKENHKMGPSCNLDLQKYFHIHLLYGRGNTMRTECPGTSTGFGTGCEYKLVSLGVLMLSVMKLMIFSSTSVSMLVWLNLAEMLLSITCCSIDVL